MNAVREVREPAGRPLLDPAFLADPYPAYAALREAAPLHWSAEFFGGAWLLTRHDDVEQLLRDPRFSAQRTGGWVMDTAAEGGRSELQGLQRIFARAMLFLDAPDHQRIRRVLGPAFRPDTMQQLAPRIEAMLEELLGGVDASRGFDAVECLTRPLPARVIAHLLGIDDAAHARYAAWSDDLAAFIGAPQPTLDDARRAQSALLAMCRLFGARPAPDGLVSRLADAAAAGSIAPGAELLAQCAMLLFAGHETTRNLLGNALWHLLSRPGLWQRLQHTPDLVGSALREVLRYDSPVQYTGRRAAADMVLHGQPVQRGDLLIGLIAAANRDPRRHADADRFDIARPAVASLAFGAGPHACIGAALTMVEAETVLRHLLRRWPKLALAEASPQWSGNVLYRGPARLMLRAA